MNQANTRARLFGALLLSSLASLSTHAASITAGGIEFTGSGFLTVAAGKIVGGDPETNILGYSSPTFVADYGQAGIYEKNQGWSLGPDSKLGLQGTAKFSPAFSMTTQLVVRGAHNGYTDLEWLYGSYRINDKLTVQVGRKRLPLFYYSESQDVGLSMPWVRLPPQAYGWDIVNYNGANLLYQDQWGDWSSSAEFFFGDEKRRDNPYQRIYNGKHSKTNERWSNIVGADLTLSRDWFEARFSYVESDWEYWGDAAQGKAKQQFYAAAFNADYEKWVVRSEFSYINRRETYENDFAQLLAVGYRIGKWLPMVTYANFNGNYIDNTAGFFTSDASEKHTTRSVSLRYDLTASSAIKAQYDWWSDRSAVNGPVQGNPRLLSVSYDLVF